MLPSLQTLLVFAFIAVAAGYLLTQVRVVFKPRIKTGCGSSCSGCSANLSESQPKSFVDIEQLTSSTPSSTSP